MVVIFVEMIQGEGGVNVCMNEFFVGLWKFCNEYNLLLLFDEVQCGIGCIGKFFVFEYVGVQFDVIGMVKGFGGGMLIGVVWICENVVEFFQFGLYGMIFGGMLFVCVVVFVVFDVVEKDKFFEKVLINSMMWIIVFKQFVKDFFVQFFGVCGQGYFVGL